MPDLEQAQRELDAGHNIEALREAIACLQLNPQDGMAWYVAAKATVRTGSVQQSLSLFDKASQLHADSADIWTDYSAALNDLGMSAPALHAATEAIVRDTKSHQAYYQRGRAYAGLNHHWWALSSYTMARAHAPDPAIYTNALHTEWQRPPRYPHPLVRARTQATRFALLTTRRHIHFVSLTRGQKEDTDIYRSLKHLNIESFDIIENNTRGIPECYNEFIDRFAGQDVILVFVHDDVLLSDAFFLEKLTEASGWFNIIGIAGASQFVDAGQNVLSWHSAAHTKLHISGAVTNKKDDELAVYVHFGLAPAECVTVDGVLMAIDMLHVGNVRFDERYQFHLYDLDFCVEAFHQGLTIGTSDTHIIHESPGNFYSEAYISALNQFRLKHKKPLSFGIHTSLDT